MRRPPYQSRLLRYQYIKYLMPETEPGRQESGAGRRRGGPAHPGGDPPAAPRRQPWRFRAHARRLGIPDPVSGYLLDAVGEGADVPSMLRRAALIGAADGLIPDGLAAQVRRLLAWDYKKRPGDYAGNPKGESIPVFKNGARGGHGAGPGCRSGPDRDREVPPDAARMHLDWIAERKWAPSCYRYGHVLPGYGTFYDRCGKYFTRGCLDHADGSRRSRRARRWCYRLSCSVCYESAIRKGAARGAHRMAARAIHRKSPLAAGRRQLIYHHMVVSVNPRHCGLLETPEGVERYRRGVYKQTRWLGYLGGAAVYHQWSFEGGRQRYRPHFHVIAAGYVDRDRYLDRHGRRIMLGKMDSDPIREVNRRTGDVYAKISHAGSAREIYSILCYLLTHVSVRVPEHPAGADGLDPGAVGSRPKAERRNHGQAITYFGDLAPGKFSSKTVLSSSRDAGRDIDNIVRMWERKAENWELPASASIQPVTCPPRGGAARRGEPCGSMFDADPRTAEYGAVERMPLYMVGERLRGLAADGDNAPPAKSAGDAAPGGAAPEPYRYVVIKLWCYEKHGGVHVRSAPAVIALDPSTTSLCRECRGPLRVIVRVDGGGIPPPDDGRPEGEQCTHDDAADWKYHRPRGRHAGMGMPYYGRDGSLRWDKGLPNMPADYRSLPPKYRRCLRKSEHYDILRYMVAAMLRRNPNVNRGAAKRAVRRYIARAGLPDRTQDGWEEAFLAGVLEEYADIMHTARPPDRHAPGD